MAAVVSTVIYALLLIVGGAMGYIKAQSLPSLISGVFSGALALVAAVLMFKDVRAGWWLAVVLAIALLLFGGKSWLLDHKAFMPRGLIFVFSAAELATLVALALRKPV